jgi:hypothetical protein
MSPLRYSLRHAGAIALAQQDYAGQFFRQRRAAGLCADDRPAAAEPKIKELQDLIDERHRGRKTRIGRCCCIPA